MAQRQTQGYYVVHNYKIKDNWDGHFCPDYCVGCGSCSCRVCSDTVFAATFYERPVKIVTYYCKDCKDQTEENKTKSITDKIFDDEEDEKIALFKDEFQTSPLIICTACKKEVDKLDAFSFLQTTYDQICLNCVTADEANKIKLHRLRRSTFTCDQCNATYQIIVNGHIRCDLISKFGVYISKQTHIDLKTGEVTHKQVIDECPNDYDGTSHLLFADGYQLIHNCTDNHNCDILSDFTFLCTWASIKHVYYFCQTCSSDKLLFDKQLARICTFTDSKLTDEDKQDDSFDYCFSDNGQPQECMICYTCHTQIKDNENYVTKYRYYDMNMCTNCVEKNNITINKKRYIHDNVFRCDCCRDEYNIKVIGQLDCSSVNNNTS